jgi:hypothetical protein
MGGNRTRYELTEADSAAFGRVACGLITTMSRAIEEFNRRQLRARDAVVIRALQIRTGGPVLGSGRVTA